MTDAHYPHRHLLGIQGLDPREITMLLDLADGYVEQNRSIDKRKNLLRGRTVINLFFENSTRTRTSFELAGKRLGADVINMQAAGSSVQKGETLIDTAMTLNAMHLDVLVVRLCADQGPGRQNLARMASATSSGLRSIKASPQMRSK